MKPNVKRGLIKQRRFKLLQSCAAWSNSLMHSWWNVFTGGEFRCEQAVKECYSVSLSLKDCVQTITPTQTCSTAIDNSTQSLARLHPNLSLRTEAYTAYTAKSLRLKGTNWASQVSTPLLTLHTPVNLTQLWVQVQRSTVSREGIKLARRLRDSCMSNWMRETGYMKWKTAPWSAMSTAAHQFSEG